MIHTSRLLLRRWREEDREPFAALNADPEVMRHFPAPLDRAASDEAVDRYERHFDEHGYGLWAVEVDGTFIGFTGLNWTLWEAPFTPAVEIGWRLARSAWGHGYATEAARAAMAYAFDQAGLDHLISITTTGNLRSQAVMRRIGMTRNPTEDFDHPRLPAGHPLCRHVLFRTSRPH